MKPSNRPYVICHMVPSVDGRIVTARWSLSAHVYAEYERTARTFGAQAWLIGRISMEPYAGKATVPRRKVRRPIPKCMTPFCRRWKGASLGRAMVANGFTDTQHLDALARAPPSGRGAPRLELIRTAIVVVPRLSAMADPGALSRGSRPPRGADSVGSSAVGGG